MNLASFLRPLSLLDGLGELRDVSIELVPAGAQGLGLVCVVAQGRRERVVAVDHLRDLRVLLVEVFVEELCRKLPRQTFFL